MKPISVPDANLLEGFRRVTLGAPPGLEKKVRPLECLQGDGRFLVLCELDDKDKETGRVWLSIWTDFFPPIGFLTVGDEYE